ncbi:MAG TPA: hypothetical protein VIH67_15900 [Candidatus Acidoferrum sp.]
MASLVAAGPSPAKVIPLGIVTHAERAHVGDAATSVGSTIYEGDRLSTDVGGALRINGHAVTLQLDAQSLLIVRQSTSPVGDILAELASGTLIFSAAPNAGIAVAADDASIRPARKASTIAYIRVVSRKELRISAQRGAVEFSYHGESEVIMEGKTYMVLLDPSEKETVAALGSEQAKKGSINHRPTFLLLAITFTAAVVIPVIIHALESPDRPGSKLLPSP